MNDKIKKLFEEYKKELDELYENIDLNKYGLDGAENGEKFKTLQNKYKEKYNEIIENNKLEDK